MTLTRSLTAVLMLSALQPSSATEELQPLVDESHRVLKVFKTELQNKLKSAIKEGGPINAIQACNEKAAPIGMKLSEKKGIKVARTSLKVRNPDNAPDEWETQILNQFESRKAAGEKPTGLEHAVIIEKDGQRVFRYMKAIPTASIPCLACHGENLKPEIAAKLDELYPNDKARGFKKGDLRGAFSLTKILK